MPTREAMFRDSTLLEGEEVTAYKSLVGSMSWFASSLRWDCVHAVSRLQMGMHEPTRGMMGAAMERFTNERFTKAKGKHSNSLATATVVEIILRII